VEVANIWIVNKSDVNEPANRYEVNYQDAFIPPGYGAPILENTPLYLNPAYGNDYTVKVVSTLGSIKSIPVTASGSTNLLAEIFAIPPDVRQGENVTIAMRVTNVGDTPLVDVEPHYIPPDVKPISEITTSEFISPSPVTLDPTESTIFTWHFTVSPSAALGGKVAFTSAVNGTDSASGFDYLSNNATAKIVVRDPTGGSGETIVINQDLYSKPEIQVIMPAPFGDVGGGGSDPKALWGVNVANPTESIMNVTKVVFTAIDPEGGGGFHMFKKNACNPENITPPPLGGPGNWWCDLNNQLTWMTTGTPVQIPPRSVASFLAKIETHGIGGGGTDLQSMPIQVTVVTSSGQFGKAGYDSSMSASQDVLANIFLGNGLGTINNDNINSLRTGITKNSIGTFNIWLVDFGDEVAEKIKGTNPDNKLTSLIINIPQNWEVQTPLPPSNDVDWKIIYYTFPDGSSQIIGQLKNDLWNDGKKITFDLKAPNVAAEKMYVMYALANGVSEDDFSVSPLTEIVLQVVP